MAGQESRSSSDDGCLDEEFEALGDRHRRRVLVELVERPDATLDELLPEDDAVEDRDRLEVLFHHSHLPSLDDAGFVEWDGERRIARGAKFESVAPVHELLADNPDRLPGEWP